MARLTRRQALQYGVASTVGITGLAGCLGGDSGNGNDGNGNGGSGDYPEDDIEVIIPFPEGGAADAYARNILPHAMEEFGVNAQIVNEAGAASLRGAGRTMQANPDGYTIGNWNPASTPLSYMVYQPDGYDLQEAKGVSQVGRITDVLFANPDLGVEGLDDLVERYQSGELTQIAGQQKGGIKHVVAQVMRDEFPLEWETYVSYDGSPPVVESVASGEVPVGLGADGAAYGGREELDIVAALGSNGSPLFPDAPAVTDLGYPDIDFVAELGVAYYAPPETPDNRIETLAGAIENAMGLDEVEQWSEETGFALDYGGPEAATQLNQEAFEKIPEAVDIESLREEVEE